MKKAVEEMGGDVKTTGHLRMLACASLTAMVKGEISNNDALTVAKTLDAVAKSMTAEIQAKKLKMQIVHDAKMVINASDSDFKLGNLEIGHFTEQKQG